VLCRIFHNVETVCVSLVLSVESFGDKTERIRADCRALLSGEAGEGTQAGQVIPPRVLAKPLASKASHLWILEYPASRCCAVYSIMSRLCACKDVLEVSQTVREAVARLKNRPELLKSASSPRVFVARFKGQPLVDLGVPCLEVLCRIFHNVETVCVSLVLSARSVADGAGGGRSTQEPTRTAQVCLFPESICCSSHIFGETPRFKGQPLVDLGVPCLEVLCRIFHNVETVDCRALLSGEAGEGTQAGQVIPPRVFSSRARTQNRGKEFGPDGHVARRERAQFGVGEGEAGEKDVHEGPKGCANNGQLTPARSAEQRGQVRGG
jgi:hypothetical protein